MILFSFLFSNLALLILVVNNTFQLVNHRQKCSECDYEFCWMCHGVWEDPENWNHEDCQNTLEQSNDRAAQLMNYLMTKISLECDKNLVDSDTIKNHIENLQKGGLSQFGVSTLNRVYFSRSNNFQLVLLTVPFRFIWFYLQTLCLKKAVNILCKSRKKLMNSFIFSHSIEPQEIYDAQYKLFEMHQNGLRLAIEKLETYLNKEITSDNAKDIFNKIKNTMR